MSKDEKRPHQKPSEEAIQKEIHAMADEIYRKRTAAGKPGDELGDWLKAEIEIRRKYN